MAGVFAVDDVSVTKEFEGSARKIAQVPQGSRHEDQLASGLRLFHAVSLVWLTTRSPTNIVTYVKADQ